MATRTDTRDTAEREVVVGRTIEAPRMHGPDGTNYPNYIEFREIVTPERIVYLHGERADDPNPFVATITFAERGASTEVTIRALFKTKQQRDEVVERYQAIEGGKQTLGRLATYVATLAPARGN